MIKSGTNGLIPPRHADSIGSHGAGARGESRRASLSEFEAAGSTYLPSALVLKGDLETRDETRAMFLAQTKAWKSDCPRMKSGKSGFCQPGGVNRSTGGFNRDV